ncbi:MAG: DUF1624 domain-containing protein [Acidobacteria bacterium]|nr:DUF1624 domain-containing protein [Acidobacteriota bacterium]
MSSSSKRLYFLDLFRGVFALIMLQGHTFRALLDSAAKEGAAYRYHELIHNLPGPAFLFASGVAFSMATLAYWENYREWGTRLRTRLLRWLALLAIGYLLHLTYFSLDRTLSESTSQQILFLFSLDILHCIALSSLFLQLLVILLPSREWFFRAIVALTIVVAVATPVIWDVAGQLPFWLGTGFSDRWGSTFPLFPYAGFAWAGAVWGYLHVAARQKGIENRFLQKTRRFSIWLCLASLVVTFLPLPALYSDFWETGPTFFFLRVGVLAWLLVGFRRAEPRVAPYFGAVVLLGRESLLVYAVHLVILYGSAINPDRNLRKWLGGDQPMLPVTLVLVLLVASLWLLCWLWTRWKEGPGWKAKGMRWGLVGYLAYAFVTG